MIDKRCTIKDALELINDGDSIAIGGFTLYRRPVGFCKELSLSQKKDLSIVTLTAGIETDILAEQKKIKSIRTCYSGLEILGRTPNISKQIEESKLKIYEETEYTLSYGVLAAMMKVPKLPCSSVLYKTDYIKYRDFTTDDKTNITYIPAINVNVAIIHVQKADIRGNAIITGQYGLDPFLPFIAEKTILTTEKIVDTSEFNGSNISIFQQQVDAVVELPNGAFPTSCYPHYPVDVSAIINYLDSKGVKIS